jgi:acyl carrier protein
LNYGQRGVRAFNRPMPVSTEFAAKSPAQIAEALLGFEPSCVAAALRYRESGEFEDFWAMLPGIIAFHLPSGATRPPAVMEDGMRLNEDLGLDSLALTEMAFLLDEVFQLSIETRDVVGVMTVGDLKAFLKRKLETR